MTELLTIEAETALRRLGALRGFFNTGLSLSQGRPSVGRLGPARPETRSSEQQLTTLREVVIVRAVSVLEAYVFDVVETELEAQIDPVVKNSGASQLVSHLAEYRWEPIKASGAWVRLLDFARDGLGLPPKAFAQWQDVTLLRETRHAIVHRVGEITKKYLAVAEKVGLLRELARIVRETAAAPLVGAA